MSAKQTVSPQEIQKIAQLAKLRLDVAQLDTYTEQINAILAHAQSLEQVDLTGVEPLAHVLDLTNVARPDRPAPSLERDKVLANAPQTEEGAPEKRATDGEFFLVPRIIKSGP